MDICKSAAQLNTLFNPSIMIRITQKRQTPSGRVAKKKEKKKGGKRILKLNKWRA